MKLGYDGKGIANALFDVDRRGGARRGSLKSVWIGETVAVWCSEVQDCHKAPCAVDMVIVSWLSVNCSN